MSQRVLFEIRQLSPGLSGTSFLHGELCQAIIMPFIIMVPFISSLWQTWRLMWRLEHSYLSCLLKQEDNKHSDKL